MTAETKQYHLVTDIMSLQPTKLAYISFQLVHYT